MAQEPYVCGAMADPVPVGNGAGNGLSGGIAVTVYDVEYFCHSISSFGTVHSRSKAEFL